MSIQTANAKSLGGAETLGSRPTWTSRELALLASALFPVLLLAGLLAVGVARKQVSQEQLDAAIAELAADGEPLGNHSLAVDFDRRTESAKSQEWRDVLMAINELDSRFSPYASEHIADAAVLVPPGVPWTPAPLAERYVQESEPIVRRIERLTASPEPVWQPLILDGFNTLLPDLQESRSVSLFLHHHFRYAFHQDDHEAALRALELAARFPDAFDWRIGIISDLIYFASQGRNWNLVRESLQHDFWTTDELRQIDSLLQHREDFDVRWQQAIAADRAYALADTAPSFASRARLRGHVDEMVLLPLGISAEARLDYVRKAERMQMLRGTGTRSHLREVAALQEHFQGRADPMARIAGIPLADSGQAMDFWTPAWTAFANSFVRQAMSHRWTRCAVAIKRFELQHDRWPESLAELSEVGLAPTDWHAVEGVPFGYQVSEDGWEALLWRFPSWEVDGDDVSISPVPPSQTDVDPDRLEMLEIRIR